MAEVNLFLDWLFNTFSVLISFVQSQHVIIQAVVFMPLALLVVKLFLIIFNSIFKGGSQV